MKSSTKALIAFIVIAVIALGATIGGAFMEKDFLKEIAKSISDPEYGYNTVEHKEEDGQNITAINFYSLSGDIKVVSGKDFNLSATTKQTTTEYGYDNGTFNFKEKSVSNLWRVPVHNKYVLTVPEGKDVMLDIESESGDIAVSELVNNANMYLHGASADIEIVGATVAAAEITSLSGSLEVKNLQGSSLKMATQSGDVNCENVNVAGAITATSKSGDIWLKLGSASSAMLESMSGGVSVDNTATALTLKLKSISGDIILTNPTNSNIDLQSTSGDVIISMKKSQFNLEASTTSGDVKYDGVKKGKPFNENSGSQFNLIAKTVSGDVEFYTNKQN